MSCGQVLDNILVEQHFPPAFNPLALQSFCPQPVFRVPESLTDSQPVSHRVG